MLHIVQKKNMPASPLAQDTRAYLKLTPQFNPTVSFQNLFPPCRHACQEHSPSLPTRLQPHSNPRTPQLPSTRERSQTEPNSKQKARPQPRKHVSTAERERRSNSSTCSVQPPSQRLRRGFPLLRGTEPLPRWLYARRDHCCCYR